MKTRRIGRARRGEVICVLVLGSMLLGCEAVPERFEASDASLTEAPTRRLTVSGPRLLDALGREVVLRGVNVGGRAKMPPYLPFDRAPGESTASAADDFFRRIARLGANVVRLTFSWEAYERTRGTYDAAYLAQYRLLLDAAHTHGLAVIVDFHQDAFSSAFCGDGFPEWALGPIPHGAPHYDCGFPYWSLPALVPLTNVSFAFDRLWKNTGGLQDAMEAMWRSVASALASHPAVAAFEIMNEPAAGNFSSSNMDGTILPTFHERMGRAIQSAAGSTVPVLWDTRINTTGLPAALRAPSLPNAVFAPHYYEPAIMLGVPAVNATTITNDLTAAFSARAKWNVPVLLGEFGVPNGNPAKAAYLDFVLDTLDALRGHATMWDVSASATLWNGEAFSALNPDRSEQPWAAVLDRAYPRAVAGTIASFSWDASAKRFLLDVTAATEGTSEIHLPTRHLGAAPRIQVTGALSSSWNAADELLRVTAARGAAFHVEVTR